MLSNISKLFIQSIIENDSNFTTNTAVNKDKTIKIEEISMEEILNKIYKVLDNVEIDENTKNLLVANLEKTLDEEVTLKTLKNKLDVLYNYEKNYLELLKDYKEEIKFASSIQEDLRKERAKFFAETLKEVQATLKDSQVDSTVASKWIQELVSSYTKSLDLSGGLIEEHTLDMIGKIRKESKQEVKKSKID